MSSTRARTITATLSPTTIQLSGDTYPLRNELRIKGFMWNAANQSWHAAHTPDLANYARSVASVVAHAAAPETAQQAPETTQTTIETPEQQEAFAADHVQRRRVSRAADREAPPTTAPTTSQAPAQASSELLEAMAKFVAATQSQQQAPQASVDLTQVLELIKQETAKALESVQSTRVIIQTQDKPETVVEGLHHYMLPTLVRVLKTKQNVWIAGPSGSGKTHAAEQAAQALGLTFALQGSMTMAHELIGFVDAGGKYHETPFVRTFRNGGLILLDELDAGSSEALLTLNAALANGIMSLHQR
jgi:flagellar biosynthesis GTPase FlhF